MPLWKFVAQSTEPHTEQTMPDDLMSLEGAPADAVNVPRFGPFSMPELVQNFTQAGSDVPPWF